MKRLDFDAKHLAKRLRNNLICKNLSIGSSTLTTKYVSAILKLLGSNSNSIEQLVSPEDRQNVSLATDFLNTFSKSVKEQTLETCTVRVALVVPPLQLLGMIMEGVLSIYAYTDYNIRQQLSSVSKAAHSLLVLKLTLGRIMPNQLYHDLMCTFQNIFFCAAKYQVNHSS